MNRFHTRTEEICPFNTPISKFLEQVQNIINTVPEPLRDSITVTHEESDITFEWKAPFTPEEQEAERLRQITESTRSLNLMREACKNLEQQLEILSKPANGV